MSILIKHQRLFSPGSIKKGSRIPETSTATRACSKRTINGTMIREVHGMIRQAPISNEQSIELSVDKVLTLLWK